MREGRPSTAGSAWTPAATRRRPSRGSWASSATGGATASPPTSEMLASVRRIMEGGDGEYLLRRPGGGRRPRRVPDPLPLERLEDGRGLLAGGPLRARGRAARRSRPGAGRGGRRTRAGARLPPHRAGRERGQRGRARRCTRPAASRSSPSRPGARCSPVGRWASTQPARVMPIGRFCRSIPDVPSRTTPMHSHPAIVGRLIARFPPGRTLPDDVWHAPPHGAADGALAARVGLTIFAWLRGYSLIHSLEHGAPAGRARVHGHGRKGQPPRGRRVRLARPDHLVGAARPQLGRRDRGALPLLRDDRAADPLRGLVPVPARRRLRRDAPRRDGRARPGRRLQPPGRRATIRGNGRRSTAASSSPRAPPAS